MTTFDGLSPFAKGRLLDFVNETQEANSDFHIDMLLEARDDTLLSIRQLGNGTLAEIDRWLLSKGMSRSKQKHFGKWHLIDTAPRDGLRRLLFVAYRGRAPVCGNWVWFKDHTRGYWTHDKLRTEKYRYRCGPHELPQPSHWMPLPENPVEE